MLYPKIRTEGWFLKLIITAVIIFVLSKSQRLDFAFGAKIIDQLPGMQTGVNITFPDEQSADVQILIVASSVALLFILFEAAQHGIRNKYVRLMALIAAVLAISNACTNVERLWLANKPASESINVIQKLFSDVVPPNVIYVDKFGERLKRLEDGTYVYQTAEAITETYVDEVSGEIRERILEINYPPLTNGPAFEKIPTFGDGLVHVGAKLRAIFLVLALGITISSLLEIGIAIGISMWLDIVYIPKNNPLKVGQVRELLISAGYSRDGGDIIRITEIILKISNEADQRDALEWFTSLQMRTELVRERIVKILTAHRIPAETNIDYVPQRRKKHSVTADIAPDRDAVYTPTSLPEGDLKPDSLIPSLNGTGERDKE